MRHTIIVRGLRAVLAVLVISAAVCTAHAAEYGLNEATINSLASDVVRYTVLKQVETKGYYHLDDYFFKNEVLYPVFVSIRVHVINNDKHNLRVTMRHSIDDERVTMIHDSLMPDKDVIKTLAAYEAEAANIITRIKNSPSVKAVAK